MSLRDLAPGESLGCARDDVVVVVPVYGGHEHLVRCLSSLLRHTPADVRILIADDASPEPRSHEWTAALPVDRELLWLRQEENQGFVGNCNAAFAATAPADVVLVNSDVVVAAGWFEGLQDAARSDESIATATALTNHGSILSVPYRNTPVSALPAEVDFDAAAARLRALSTRLHPRIPTAIGHCVYIRRPALELVGGFDTAFAPAYGEEVDFSQRCVACGLQHVAADDVLVLHHGHASLGVEGEVNPLQKAHDELIESRYRYWPETVAMLEDERFSPLARALMAANRAVRGISVTIDGRCLNPFMTGTQVHVIEVIAALARTGLVRLRVAVPHDLGSYARRVLDTLEDVQIVEARALLDDPDRTDIVHRPYQVSDPRDLEFLATLGDRLVLTHQDLIAYRNPAYFRSARAWQAYRRLTAEAMALSSLVLFFSEHARADALADDLVPAERARVVLLGTDHAVAIDHPDPEPPPVVPGLGERPFLLCLGTTFRHKNRPFALRLLQALKERHGWDGRLVLAGPDVAQGSSLGAEAEWLGLHPETVGDVVTLAAVSEAEKRWLLEECAAVVYPTTYEGFGLVPFEAAHAGAPCLFAPVSSLAELAPEAALLVPWDADLSADRCIDVLRDPQARAEQVARVRDAGAVLTWDRAAEGLLAAYDAALALPASELLRLEGAELAQHATYWHFRHAIGPTGLSLVEPDQQLLPEEIQRTIAALARRPSTRGPLFAGLRGLRRLSGPGHAEPVPEAPTEPVKGAVDEDDEDALERLFPDSPPGY